MPIQFSLTLCLICLSYLSSVLYAKKTCCFRFFPWRHEIMASLGKGSKGYYLSGAAENLATSQIFWSRPPPVTKYSHLPRHPFWRDRLFILRHSLLQVSRNLDVSNCEHQAPLAAREVCLTSGWSYPWWRRVEGNRPSLGISMNSKTA